MWDKWRRWVAARQLQRLDGAPVVVVRGVGPIAEAIKYAQGCAAQGKYTLVVGVLRDDNSREWQLSLSRAGQDLTWVAAHPSYQHISTLIDWITYAAQQNDLQDDATFHAFLAEVGSLSAGRS